MSTEDRQLDLKRKGFRGSGLAYVFGFTVLGLGFRVVGFGFRVGAFGGGGLVSYAAWRGFIVIQVLQGFLLDKKRAIPKPANLAWIVRV